MLFTRVVHPWSGKHHNNGRSNSNYEFSALT